MPHDRNDLGGLYSDPQTEEFAKRLATISPKISGMGELQNEANKMAKYLSSDSDEKNLKASLPIGNTNTGACAKMPSYIGTKVVCAVPMTECTFLRDHKGQEVGDREDINGYYVQYEDGYKSWSPKNIFERSYRLITDAEKKLI